MMSGYENDCLYLCLNNSRVDKVKPLLLNFGCVKFDQKMPVGYKVVVLFISVAKVTTNRYNPICLGLKSTVTHIVASILCQTLLI